MPAKLPQHHCPTRDIVHGYVRGLHNTPVGPQPLTTRSSVLQSSTSSLLVVVVVFLSCMYARYCGKMERFWPAHARCAGLPSLPSLMKNGPPNIFFPAASSSRHIPPEFPSVRAQISPQFFSQNVKSSREYCSYSYIAL